MNHLRATKETIVVSLVDINKKKEGIIVPTSASDSIVLFGRVHDSKTELYPKDSIVIFPSQVGHKLTLDKKTFIIFRIDQVIGTIEEESLKIPPVYNDPGVVSNLVKKWTSTGIVPRSEELENTIAILLENQLLSLQKDYQNESFSKKLTPFALSSIVKIFKDNERIQASLKLSVSFGPDDSGDKNLVSTARLGTKISFYDIENGNTEEFIKNIKKEIESIGECVVYTPLMPVPLSLLSPTEDNQFGFMIRYWKPKELK